MASLHLVLACALLTACGEQHASAPTSAGGLRRDVTPTPLEDPREDLTRAAERQARRPDLRLAGTVSPGVEAGCHLLTAAARRTS